MQMASVCGCCTRWIQFSVWTKYHLCLGQNEAFVDERGSLVQLCFSVSTKSNICEKNTKEVRPETLQTFPVTSSTGSSVEYYRVCGVWSFVDNEWEENAVPRESARSTRVQSILRSQSDACRSCVSCSIPMHEHKGKVGWRLRETLVMMIQSGSVEMNAPSQKGTKVSHTCTRLAVVWEGVVQAGDKPFGTNATLVSRHE